MKKKGNKVADKKDVERKLWCPRLKPVPPVCVVQQVEIDLPYVVTA